MERSFITNFLVLTAILFTCFHYCTVPYHIMKDIAYSLSSYTLISFVTWKVFFIYNKFIFQIHPFCNCEQTKLVQNPAWRSDKAVCSPLKVTSFLSVHRTCSMKKWKQKPWVHVTLIMKYSTFHLYTTDSKWKLLPCDHYSVTHTKCADDFSLVPSRYLSVS